MKAGGAMEFHEKLNKTVLGNSRNSPLADSHSAIENFKQVQLASNFK